MRERTVRAIYYLLHLVAANPIVNTGIDRMLQWTFNVTLHNLIMDLGDVIVICNKWEKDYDPSVILMQNIKIERLLGEK